MNRELSIFIDESGDFGAYEPYCPFYIFSLVLHEQFRSISEQTETLESRLTYADMDPHHCFHTMPLIRGEADYHDMSLQQRRKLMGYLFAYTRSVPVHYAAISVDKYPSTTVIDLTAALSKRLSAFIAEHLKYFHSFDKIIVYYDNGQTELTRIIVSVFTIMFPNVEFRRVEPVSYRLFQIADLCCTMELIRMKHKNNSLNKSERIFFGNSKYLRKNYLNHLEALHFHK